MSSSPYSHFEYVFYFIYYLPLSSPCLCLVSTLPLTFFHLPQPSSIPSLYLLSVHLLITPVFSLLPPPSLLPFYLSCVTVRPFLFPFTPNCLFFKCGETLKLHRTDHLQQCSSVCQNPEHKLYTNPKLFRCYR